ncbi:MAG: Mfa1 fimbrilin C-terminal domain-containing protein [Muribaculaceae bacterium]|nr:Mfa1 fimbrilin C-terminal domain-containing protein [Muribaculaceae bacterium]
MKKICGFLGVAALMALASCANDKLDGPDNGQQVQDGEVSYVNVILSLSGLDTKADGDDYKYGTKEESEIKTLVLAFYDASGNLLEAKELTGDGTDGTHTSTSQNVAVEKEITTIEVKDFTKNYSASIVAYVNIPASEVQNKSLSAMKAIKNVSDLQNTTDKSFKMTNSGYYDNSNNYVMEVPVSVSNFYKKGDSSARAVEIYVERLAAKATVAELKGIQAYKVIEGENTEVELTFVPQTWFVQNLESESYLLKNMPPTKSSTYETNFASWFNRANDHRCFWAQSAGYSSRNLTKNDYTTQDGSFSAKSGEDGTYESVFSLSNGAANNGKYLHENTFASTTDWADVTSIIIVGKYKIHRDASEIYDDETFYLRDSYIIDNGEAKAVQKIYNEEGVKKALFSSVTGIKKGNEALTTNSVKLKHVSDNVYVLELEDKEGEDYVIDGVEGKSYADVNAELAKIIPAYKYHEGKAYFAVPLKNYDSSSTNTKRIELAAAKEGNYGIVRNRWYELTVNSIKGLGTGISGEEDDKDEPEPSDDPDVYVIDATLKVLQWHSAGQTVDL